MAICLVNSSILRQLWSVIEETQSTTILRLSDADLVNQLLGQLNSQKALTTEESTNIGDYIYSRTSLIRDIAQAR